MVALLVIADVLKKEEGKVLFLAPTKPLVEQHASFLQKNLIGKRIAMMTGEKSPRKRKEEWMEGEIIVSTPQVVANDLEQKRIDLGGVKLIVFDEAHRAVGKYSYVTIASAYASQHGLVMGMTASPGASKEKIAGVCKNLGIENIEVRTESDDDVSSYVYDIDMEWVEVEVPDQLREVAAILRHLYDSFIKQLVSMRVMSAKRPPTIMYLLEVNKSLQARLRSGGNRGYIFRALSIQAMAMKIGHAVELAETQGLTALTTYIGALKQEAASSKGSKASRSIISSPDFARADSLLEGMKGEHPKIPRVMHIISHQLQIKPDSRILVFTNFRDSCEMVTNHLAKVDGVKVSKLVGQTDRGNDKGLRQKEQVEVLSRLRKRDVNVVVATCVGEEGLDIEDTDLVIFYEPVPSAIRSIQRRGRTGRSSIGRVVIFITRGTKDETSVYSSTRKEKAMRKNLFRVKKELDAKSSSKAIVKSQNGQCAITDF